MHVQPGFVALQNAMAENRHLYDTYMNILVNYPSVNPVQVIAQMVNAPKQAAAAAASEAKVSELRRQAGVSKPSVGSKRQRKAPTNAVEAQRLSIERMRSAGIEVSTAEERAWLRQAELDDAK